MDSVVFQGAMAIFTKTHKNIYHVNVLKMTKTCIITNSGLRETERNISDHYSTQLIHDLTV